MLTISCLKSPALFPLLTPAVLISYTVPSWPSYCWRRQIWIQPQNNVGKPVLHMQHTCSGEPAAQRSDALARPASNNMPLSEHDAQGLRKMLYLRAEGMERKERFQYLRQTSILSIWSEEDDELYSLPDPEVPLVYSLRATLHCGQQCPPESDDSSLPAETTDQQRKDECGKSNLHAEEDSQQKIKSMNFDP